MDFHDFPRFLGKSGMDLMHPPKLCAILARTAPRNPRTPFVLWETRRPSRTRRPTLNARGSSSTNWSVAFTAADVELRRARFRRAHQVHVRVGVSETRQILIHKNVSV